VNVYAKGYEPDEPSLYVNPLNPLNIIAGANTDNFYYTFDGGKTWDEGKLPGPVVWGDPVLYFDNLGNAYYVHLGFYDDTGIYMSRSSDGGRTWSSSVRIFGRKGSEPFEDKPWIASDRSGSPYKNNLYLSWTQFDKYHSDNPLDSSRILFTRSTNAGDNFSAPIVISDKGGDARDGDSTVEGAVPCVGPEGQIYVAWSGERGIQFDRSFDGGLTFGTDVFVTEQVGGWSYDIPGLYRCNGLPFTDCDISESPYKGNVYINFSDSRNGDHDIFLVRSGDSGATWSEPVRVNDDSIGNGKEQFMSHFTVDRGTGDIYVLFYDRRNYDDTQTDVYLAVSKDGGKTFTNQKISESSFIPVKAVFFGDYINIHALNGVYSAIWMRMDKRVMSLQFATNRWENK
jgi:hypothetical protein